MRVLDVSWTLKKRIEREEGKLKQWRSLMGAITREIDGQPRGANRTSYVEHLSVKILDQERLIEQLKEIRAACIMELSEMLSDKLDDANQRAVLLARYGYCHLFRDIGFALGFSEAHVYYLHRTALDKLNSKIIVR